MKVLIVDDNRDNLYYLSALLQSKGHEVVSAMNGREALDRLQGSGYDLIISDVLMPEMDGFQLCRECRKTPRFDSIPFMFYTATYIEEDDRRFGLSLGADEYIIKPMEPDALIDVITRITEEKTQAEGGLDEREYLTAHNERLVRKLESKMQQLEESNRRLENEVAERIEAEEVIRQSEERFRTIFDTVQDAIFLQDIESGHIVDMNRVARGTFGYDPGEVSIVDLCDETYRDDGRRDIRELVRAAAEGESVLCEWKMRSFSERIFWTEIQMKPVRFGTVDRLLIVIRDIDKRKAAEMALMDQTIKLQTLSDNAPFGMVLMNDDGQFTYINRKFREIFGWDEDEVPDGRAWLNKAYPNDQVREKATATWKEEMLTVRPGEDRHKVLTVTSGTGNQKLVNFIPLRLSSGGYLMTCEDITQFKKLEDQLYQSQKMEAIGSLAGGVAHDFNNFLTTMMGYAGLLQMEIDKHSPLGLYVDQIITASQKAANLTRSLLAFSRQQPVVLNPLNVNENIKSSQKLLGRLVTEDVEFQLSLSPDNMVIMADSTQIDQILFNLVANARDAMPRGGILAIETSSVYMDKGFIDVNGFGAPGRYAQITVSDTGVGMDDAVREKIFEPFFSTKEVGKGTGLGLSTVYGIVKQHNGFINVYSEPGRGTTFRVYFPLVRFETSREVVVEPEVRGGTETILVAEDSTALRGLVKEVLGRYGYKIIEAVDGEDAVVQFSEHGGIDLILLDSVMPKKNGREVYETIKEKDASIRVLFMSGHTKDTVLSKGIADSEFDFLPKPISPMELLIMVRKILDRRGKDKV